MFIKTEWVGGWIVFVGLIAAFTDLRYRKIYNWLTLPAMGIGLVLSTVAFSWAGLAFGLVGIVIALVAFGWMWGVRILGAGDVKLLMAFSALAGAAHSLGVNGIGYVADLCLLSLLVGGASAAVMLAIKGRLKPFFHKFYRFLLTATNRNLETEFPKADPTLKMPFGISIAIAAVWMWFDNPLVRWGMRPWS